MRGSVQSNVRASGITPGEWSASSVAASLACSVPIRGDRAPGPRSRGFGSDLLNANLDLLFARQPIAQFAPAAIGHDSLLFIERFGQRF